MPNDSSEWFPLETTTHQEHVIKHVIGATVLGWFIAGEAAHLLLDMGFLWTIYLDGAMNLLPQGIAISELDADELSGADRAALAFDAELLLNEGREAGGLERFTAAPVDCLIAAVELFARENDKRLVVQDEAARIDITCSLEEAEISVLAI